MRTVDRLILQARLLPAEEQQELLDKLQQELRETKTTTPPLSPEAQRALAYFTEQPRWTPPPKAPSVVELVREDRDR